MGLPAVGAGASGPVAVNYALLDLPVVRDGFTAPVSVVDLQVRNSVGDLVNATGYTVIGDPTADDVVVRVGPYGPAEDSVDVYRFNVTEYLQGVATGEREAAVVLVPRNRSTVARRSILNLEASDELPGARLLLATTELP